jgi:hypothetical protein
MTGLSTAAIFVIQTLGSLYLLIVLLRFILQLVRADFYNPLASSPCAPPSRCSSRCAGHPELGGIDMSRWCWRSWCSWC